MKDGTRHYYGCLKEHSCIRLGISQFPHWEDNPSLDPLIRLFHRKAITKLCYVWLFQVQIKNCVIIASHPSTHFRYCILKVKSTFQHFERFKFLFFIFFIITFFCSFNVNNNLEKCRKMLQFQKYNDLSNY